MTRAPRFSIITICRNEAAQILVTCESILSQSCRDYEWIVIDGASDDGTLDILGEHRASMAVLVSEPDRGIYDAMNKGIAHARGDYLVFMNGGDRFASDQVLDWVSQAPEADLICGDIFIDRIGGNIARAPDELSEAYLMHRTIHHQASFHRRQLFETFGPYDTRYRIRGDYEFFVRVCASGKVSYHHLPRPLAVFSKTGVSSLPEHELTRERENHRARKTHFPKYRWSLKALRRGLRLRLHRH